LEISKAREASASKGGYNGMINFDEEIEKFQPSMEIEQAEDVINNNDLTDISDILKELLKENKEK
jgi:flagellar biogenesis protein FliO